MNRREQTFVDTVWSYYRENGRHDLPWRKTTDPYRIMVSEVMLQQTQVSRVLPKYQSFIKQWGSARALARAPLAAVLTEWQGLGYNRRAKALHECAKQVVTEYKGKFPSSYTELQKLPGIGSYTAGAIMAFAYNQPVPIIETNIRSVYLHHFFKEASDISEAELTQLIERTLDHENPRKWYWALMDYGAFIKAKHGNQNSRAKSYARQSTFKGSDRQIRGAIIRALTEGSLSITQLCSRLNSFDKDRVQAQLMKLLLEEMVQQRCSKFSLPK